MCLILICILSNERYAPDFSTSSASTPLSPQEIISFSLFPHLAFFSCRMSNCRADYTQEYILLSLHVLKYFSSNLVNGCAFLDSLDLQIRRAEKEDTWILVLIYTAPVSQSYSILAYWQPLFLKELREHRMKRQEKGEVEFTDPFAASSLWHPTWLARLHEIPLPPYTDTAQQRWACSEMTFMKTSLMLKTQI